jgi:translocation and assembly module TamB
MRLGSASKERVADRRTAGGIQASFAATLVERKLAVERFQIRAAEGRACGSWRHRARGRRPFEVTATAKHIDPSRFGKFPAGKLDGDIDATGALDPSWQVTGKAAIATGSQLVGVPVSGKIHATLGAANAPRRERRSDARVGSAHGEWEPRQC